MKRLNYVRKMFWLSPSGEVVDFSGKQTHADYVLKNLKTFGMDQDKDYPRRAERSEFAAMAPVLQKGWIRGSYQVGLMTFQTFAVDTETLGRIQDYLMSIDYYNEKDQFLWTDALEKRLIETTVGDFVTATGVGDFRRGGATQFQNYWIMPDGKVEKVSEDMHVEWLRNNAEKVFGKSRDELESEFGDPSWGQFLDWMMNKALDNELIRVSVSSSVIAFETTKKTQESLYKMQDSISELFGSDIDGEKIVRIDFSKTQQVSNRLLKSREDIKTTVRDLMSVSSFAELGEGKIGKKAFSYRNYWVKPNSEVIDLGVVWHENYIKEHAQELLGKQIGLMESNYLDPHEDDEEGERFGAHLIELMLYKRWARISVTSDAVEIEIYRKDRDSLYQVQDALVKILGDAVYESTGKKVYVSFVGFGYQATILNTLMSASSWDDIGRVEKYGEGRMSRAIKVDEKQAGRKEVNDAWWQLEKYTGMDIIEKIQAIIDEGLATSIREVMESVPGFGEREIQYYERLEEKRKTKVEPIKKEPMLLKDQEKSFFSKWDDVIKNMDLGAQEPDWSDEEETKEGSEKEKKDPVLESWIEMGERFERLYPQNPDSNDPNDVTPDPLGYDKYENDMEMDEETQKLLDEEDDEYWGRKNREGVKKADGHNFCRAALKEVMKEVREKVSVEDIKKSWVHQTAGGWEMHGPNNFYDFSRKPDCSWSAKALMWRNYLAQEETKKGKTAMKEYVKLNKDVISEYSGQTGSEGEIGDVIVYDGKRDLFVVRFPADDPKSTRTLSLMRTDFDYVENIGDGKKGTVPKVVYVVDELVDGDQVLTGVYENEHAAYDYAMVRQDPEISGHEAKVRKVTDSEMIRDYIELIELMNLATDMKEEPVLRISEKRPTRPKYGSLGKNPWECDCGYEHPESVQVSPCCTMKNHHLSKKGKEKEPVEKKVTDFLKDNPKPSDDQIHGLAEELGMAPDDLEMIIYDMLASYVSGEEKIPGGKADGMEESEFPDEALDKGEKVEMEHTNDPELAREITKDHLVESEDYYKYLDEMEKKMKGKGSRTAAIRFRNVPQDSKSNKKKIAIMDGIEVGYIDGRYDFVKARETDRIRTKMAWRWSYRIDTSVLRDLLGVSVVVQNSEGWKRVETGPSEVSIYASGYEYSAESDARGAMLEQLNGAVTQASKIKQGPIKEPMALEQPVVEVQEEPEGVPMPDYEVHESREKIIGWIWEKAKKALGMDAAEKEIRAEYNRLLNKMKELPDGLYARKKRSFAEGQWAKSPIGDVVILEMDEDTALVYSYDGDVTREFPVKQLEPSEKEGRPKFFRRAKEIKEEIDQYKKWLETLSEDQVTAMLDSKAGELQDTVNRIKALEVDMEKLKESQKQNLAFFSFASNKLGKELLETENYITKIKKWAQSKSVSWKAVATWLMDRVNDDLRKQAEELAESMKEVEERLRVDVLPKVKTEASLIEFHAQGYIKEAHEEREPRASIWLKLKKHYGGHIKEERLHELMEEYYSKKADSAIDKVRSFVKKLFESAMNVVSSLVEHNKEFARLMAKE